MTPAALHASPTHALVPTLPPARLVHSQVLDVLAALSSEVWSEDAFASYPTIKAYKARFEALPAIAEYRASDKFLPRPFNNKVAKWM